MEDGEGAVVALRWRLTRGLADTGLEFRLERRYCYKELKVVGVAGAPGMGLWPDFLLSVDSACTCATSGKES
jgi:hypothetical protein